MVLVKDPSTGTWQTAIIVRCSPSCSDGTGGNVSAYVVHCISNQPPNQECCLDEGSVKVVSAENLLSFVFDTRLLEKHLPKTVFNAGYLRFTTLTILARNVVAFEWVYRRSLILTNSDSSYPPFDVSTLLLTLAHNNMPEFFPVILEASDVSLRYPISPLDRKNIVHIAAQYGFVDVLDASFHLLPSYLQSSYLICLGTRADLYHKQPLEYAVDYDQVAIVQKFQVRMMYQRLDRMLLH
jgi:hypothetical protein